MKKTFLLLLVFSFFISGCSKSKSKYPSQYPSSPSIKINEILFPQATNEKVMDVGAVHIDYSHSADGYIMVKLTQEVSKKIKIEISHNDFPYRYDIDKKEYVALPLQMGNGEYIIKVLQNLEGQKYAILKTQKINVQLTNELSPYLYPNQLVDYRKGSSVNQKALDIVKDDTNDLQRIKDIYEYVVDTLTYDDQKAIKATQRYIIPDLEKLLVEKKAICFDYASLMVAMLRINHIPARLICGDTDIEYHAWVEVYLEGEGWVNPDVFIDKEVWSRMDPTFASSKYQYDGQYIAIYYY